MAHVMPDLFKIDVKAHAITHARTEMVARGKVVATDEPPERGGTNLFATPLETMLSSFLGCTNVIANYVAGLLKIELRGMEMDICGHFDTRGVFGKADIASPFPVIELRVVLDTDASDEKIAELQRLTGEKCPVSVLLRRAGCEIQESWMRK
ncbi:OsmC family protein [Sulfitobacter albidus]|uniref:OsmC family protein n=1 Tax=Sulfitobacter albidus TaxID=2829501 RepID=A0A975JHE1_9RHOB|nr:OsmC family protein [Sulfitobacter albidus]QUJ78236.1 OsmC family protein [Sulfitobacter albidus]